MAAGWPWPLPALYGPAAGHCGLGEPARPAPSTAASCPQDRQAAFCPASERCPAPSESSAAQLQHGDGDASHARARGCASSAGRGSGGVRAELGTLLQPGVHRPRSWGDAPGRSGVQLQSWGSTDCGTARKPRTRPGSCSRGMAISHGGSSKSTEIFWQLMHHLQKTPLHPTTLPAPLHPAEPCGQGSVNSICQQKLLRWSNSLFLVLPLIRAEVRPRAGQVLKHGRC